MNSWLWIPAALLALVALGLGVSWRAPRAGAWAALAAIGQAAVLSLVKAGPLVGYQHLVPFGEAQTYPLPFALATLFVAITLIGLIRHRSGVRHFFHGRRLWPWLLAIAAASTMSAAPSEDYVVYARELLAGSVLQLAALACVALAALEVPDERVGALQQRLAQWLAPLPGPAKLDRFSWTLAIGVTIVSALLCLTSYRAIPHIPDEVGYVIQARYFAAGLPWMTPPSVPAGFDTFLIEASGNRWYSVFPPGWPLVLALGVKLGVPWLVNPLLGGACVLLAYLLVQDMADRGLARLSIAFLAVSPWHLLLSMSLMSHVLSLALALVTGLGAVRAYRTGSWPAAFIGGLALGVLGMSRPLEGVALALVAGVPLLVSAVRKGHVSALVAALGGTIATGAIGLLYNKVITNAWLRFPAESYFDREYGPGRYSIGFGPEKGMGWAGLDPFPGHGAIDVVVNAVLNNFMINVDFLGWIAGSAAIVIFGMFNARKGIDRVMLAMIMTVVLLHSAYWFSGGPDFGARYWYLTILPISIMAARGLISVEREHDVVPGARSVVAATWCSVLALTLFIPWRAVDKYYNYRGVHADLMAWKSDPQFHGGLLLVSGQRHPDWAGAAIANEVKLGESSSPIFAWDRDSTTRRLVLEAYPDRPVWLVDGPTRTGRSYEVVRGPVEPSARAALLSPREP